MDQNRQKFQGNWTCSGCGKAITELPFEPRSEEGLLCQDCHRAKRESEGGTRPPSQRHEGNWKCGKCGGEITSLPFQPDPERLDQLKCRDCHMAGK